MKTTDLILEYLNQEMVRLDNLIRPDDGIYIDMDDFKSALAEAERIYSAVVDIVKNKE